MTLRGNIMPTFGFGVNDGNLNILVGMPWAAHASVVSPQGR
jgi:hypothetical protein